MLPRCAVLCPAAGDWFCSSQCTAINELLRGYVQKGQMEIAESSGHTWQVRRRHLL